MAAIDTIKTIAGRTNSIGATFYFHPATLKRGKELGLDGFRFYVLGRGGALGDVSAAVVRAAFGYFEQGLIDSMWNSAREKAEPLPTAQAYFDECGARGRDQLAGLAADMLRAYADAADAAISTQPRGGLSLFAATAELASADDPPARAMQKAAVLRELRGSAHLCGVLASGITEAQAHCHKRPDMIQSFGYAQAPNSPDDIEDRLAEAERITDLILEPTFAELTDEQTSALLVGTEAIAAALGVE